MANNAASNAILKKRNAKIFKGIENKLASGDEEAFITAAEKLTSFVSRKEAYYPEARPTIVNICKIAKASLTRLAKSSTPFSCDRTVPQELMRRAAAYVRLIETVLQFVSTFEGDDVRVRNDLKELFRSATRAPPQSSHVEMKEQKEVEIPQGNDIANEIQAEAPHNIPQILPSLASVAPEPSSDQHKETPASHSRSALDSVIEGTISDSSEKIVPAHLAHSSPMEARQAQQTSPTLLSVLGRTAAASPSPTAESSVGTPTITISPAMTTRDTAAGMAALPQISKPTKAPAKSKKIKLKKAAPIDASLIEADLHWHSSKKLEVPGSQASPALVSPITDASSSVPAESDGAKITRIATHPSASVSTTLAGAADAPVRDGLGVATRTSPDLADKKADVNMTTSLMPLKQEKGSFEQLIDVQHSAQENAMEVDESGASSASNQRERVGVSRKDIPEVEAALEMQVVKQDGSAQSSLASEHIEAASPPLALNPAENMSPSNACDVPAIGFVSVKFGRNDSGTFSLRYDLTPEQRGLLSTWQMRDQHERDVSRSLCVSLASYDGADVKSRTENSESTPSPKALADLTPSWPMNSRLSADIGSYRLFLAPPLVVTDEGFVDISAHNKEDSIEVTLDQVADMSEYVFALVVHPPTPSQLRELDDRRAKTKRFRATLDSLRITAVDVLG